VVTLFAGRPPRGSLAEWDALTGAEDSHEVHRLDPRALERKRSAVAAYESQVPLLDQQCGGRLRGGDDLGVEVAWVLGTVGG
jgi:hypothetical protein